MLRANDGAQHQRVGQGVCEAPHSTLFFNSNNDLRKLTDDAGESRCFARFMSAENKAHQETRKVDMNSINMMHRKEHGAQATMCIPLLMEMMSVSQAGVEKMFKPGCQDVARWVNAIFGLHNSRELSACSNVLFGTLHWLVAVQAELEDYEWVFVDAIEGALSSAKLAQYSNPVELFLIAFDRVRKNGNVRPGVRGMVNSPDKFREDSGIFKTIVGQRPIRYYAFNINYMINYLTQCGEEVPDFKSLKNALDPRHATYNNWKASIGDCNYIDPASETFVVNDPQETDDGQLTYRRAATSDELPRAQFTVKAQTLFIKKDEYDSLMAGLYGSNLGDWRNVTIKSVIPAMRGREYSLYTELMGDPLVPLDQKEKPTPECWKGFASFYEEKSILRYFCGPTNYADLKNEAFGLRETIFDETENEYQHVEEMYQPETIAQYFGVGLGRPDPDKVPSVYSEAATLWDMLYDDPDRMPPTPRKYSTIWLDSKKGDAPHPYPNGGRYGSDDDDDDNDSSLGGDFGGGDYEQNSGKSPPTQT